MEEMMIDFLTAASVSAAIRQDFPDHVDPRLVREGSRRRLALHEAYSLLLTRWQRPPRRHEEPVFPMLPPL
jgi:hypothetical protein